MIPWLRGQGIATLFRLLILAKASFSRISLRFTEPTTIFASQKVVGSNLASQAKEKTPSKSSEFFLGCGGRIRTYDLVVMSHTS